MRCLDSIDEATGIGLCADSRRRRRTGKPGVLQSTGVGHDLATEQQQIYSAAQIRENISRGKYSERCRNCFLTSQSRSPLCTIKMILYTVTVLCMLYLIAPTQCSPPSDNLVTFDMMTDAFDDQYITCRKQMEKKMPAVLQQELKNNTVLAAAWKQVEGIWKKNIKKPHNFPRGFKTAHGISLDVYTMDSITVDGVSHNIYSVINRELRMAGQSREYYMNNFPYKALHYYLTRALQLMWQGCQEKITVFRGASIPKYNVTSKFRFGQFASSSMDPDIAAEFGTDPFFEISTCYGVLIAGFSFFPGEAEFLIPGQETFNVVGRNGTAYLLESTGELCSYFECAYLRNTPKKKVCRRLPEPDPANQKGGVDFMTLDTEEGTKT